MTSLTQLLPILTLKTQERKLSWEEAGDGNYIAKIANQIVSISRVRSNTGVLFRLSLLDDSGRSIESTKGGDNPKFEELLEDLYNLARKQALKVDLRLEELRKQLDAL